MAISSTIVQYNWVWPKILQTNAIDYVTEVWKV